MKEIEEMTRQEIKDLFTKDVDSYGKPMKLMTKVNLLIDYIAELECTNQDLINESMN